MAMISKMEKHKEQIADLIERGASARSTWKILNSSLGDDEKITYSAFMHFVNIHIKILSKIKKNWRLPSDVPEGYKPIAFFYKNGSVNLDFFHDEKCDYLSEYDNLAREIDFPFLDDFKPSVEDWKKIGFYIHFEYK